MKTLRRFAIAGLLAVMTAGASVGATAEPLSDAEALERLEKSGSDLTKLHRVQYQLRFATQDEADHARARLEDLAFAVTVERDDANDDFVLQAVKRMYPVRTDLEQLSTKVKAVASDDHGTYEGWRASQLR